MPREAGFQQPTVSSRLRESQISQKEPMVPWIPSSPHSPNIQRVVSMRPEPRCLFSISENTAEPPAEQLSRGERPPEVPQDPQGLEMVTRQQAHSEALRQVWLEKITSERLNELDRLSREETERIQRIRAEVGSPTDWAERAEQAARERIEPLLEQAQRLHDAVDKRGESLQHRLSEQAADKMKARTDMLSDVLLEDLLEDTAHVLRAVRLDRQVEEQAEMQDLLQMPTLETMLQRMEEMEREQEAVRRRLATNSYSDPLFWEKPAVGAGDQNQRFGPTPFSSQRNGWSRLVSEQPPSGPKIILQSPVEPSAVVEVENVAVNGLPGLEHQQPSASPLQEQRRKGAMALSLPHRTLNSILSYREKHDAYLRLVSHEAVGNFNPWTIANSLAEELMSEALADVAAEFQDACEEYAEAVFTSEFLKPNQSSPSLST